MNPRQGMRNALKATVAALPFSVQERLTRTKVFLPFYHMVSDDDVPHFAHCVESYPTVAKFEQDLDFFLRHFTPIDLAQFIAGVESGRPLPKRPMLLTFDDGYREMFEIVAPILLRRGVPAVFFINTSSLDNKCLIVNNKRSLLKHALLRRGTCPPDDIASVGRLTYLQADQLEAMCVRASLDTRGYLTEMKPYLTREQLIALTRQGFAVGAHSIDHPPYPLISFEEQLRQTLECLAELQQLLSIDYAAFAFPGSDNGVSREFFDRIAGRVSVTFGTSGGFTDDIPRHFQRTGFEYSRDSASVVLAERYAIEFLRRLTGRSIAERPN